MTAVYQEQRTVLNSLVQSWERRYRWQQTALWLPRSLLPGLFAGVVLFVAARFVPLLTALELATITAALVLAGLLVMLALIWLRSRPAVHSARQFDQQFRLGERVSTALELIDGRIQSTAELTGFQIEDAWRRGQGIDPGHELPLATDKRAWAAAVVALIAIVILFLLPNPQTPIDAQMAARQAAIDDASDQVERIMQEIAADTTLNDAERQQLLEQLEKTNMILEQEQVTPEEAFAALSEAEAELQQRADGLNQQAQQQGAAIQQVAQTLQDAMAGAGEQQETQDAIPTLEELGQIAPGMTEEQRQQMADALEQAAQQLEQTNPEAAQALRDAAEALRNGDMEAAQQALQDAADSLRQQQEQMQRQQQSGQQMQQSAQQMQQSASQVAQQQGQQQQGQPQGQQQDQQGQPDSGVQPLQQQGQQQGQQDGQQGQAGQPGQQPGETGDQPGQQAGQQPSSQQGQTQAEEQQPGVGGGAGDQQGGAGDDDMLTSPGGQVSQDNDPDGTGEGQFAPVYAPRRVGGEGGPEIILEPDSSDVPVQEGEFAQNPTGQSLVPYNQVFGDYSDAANRALESDYIPLGLRDIVRDYFSSLEPGQ
jgi:hypothetical protein